MSAQPAAKSDPRAPQQRTGKPEVTGRVAKGSPRLRARIAGGFYLLTFVTGALALFFAGRKLEQYGDAANLLSTACYIVVTVLFYQIFRPVNRSIALLATFLSFVGCSITVLSQFHLVSFPVSPLVFFGFYCLLTGYLIFKSTFLPRILGVLMALGGLGWLTYLWPPLAHTLAPYNMLLGIIGEGALTLWLLTMGVNVLRWREQASAAAASVSFNTAEQK